eukprot:GHVH01005983.1.p1 GENE.GHVH01005983.1~~GHVH01005983.1.p1  ORF type:complete len:1372 (-),score=205.95 GHVH01005983.1:152-4267(-)
MNPANILATVRRRYYEGTKGSSLESGRYYYSTIGNVLLAVNPYREIPELYDEVNLGAFERRPLSSFPHPYSLAQLVIRHVKGEFRDQSIIISGESGAGKTETSKHLLRYLTRLGGSKSHGYDETLGNRVMACNPILELFGNARTHRNCNSSRFGRMLSLAIENRHGEMNLARCSVDTSLLAKSRVTNTPSGEQNYHIFYALLSDLRLVEEILEPEVVSKCDIFGSELRSVHFRLLESSDASEIYCPFSLTSLFDSLRFIGCESSDIKLLIKVLLSILYLGNIDFVADENGDACLVPQHSTTVDTILCLLSCRDQTNRNPSSAFIDLLTRTRVKAGNESFVKRKDVADAQRSINSIITNLYAHLIFDVVIAIINRSLQVNNEVDINEKTHEYTIRILDLYGFEDMSPESINGFEQLNINFANERFQKSFMKQMVDDERTLYQDEGLMQDLNADVTKGGAQSASSIVAAFRMARFGIYAMLDQCSEEEQSIGTKQRTSGMRDKRNAFNAKFCRSVNDATLRRNQDAFIEVKFAFKDDAFVVKHFAGDVTYSCIDFVESNQDVSLKPTIARYLNENCFHGCQPSQALLEMQICLENCAIRGNDGKLSNSRMFQSQLDALSSTVESTHCWFIRCIKPNNISSATAFDDKFVLKQMINGGIVEMLKLMKKGLPFRVDYNVLWQKFSVLIPEDICNKFSSRDFAVALTRHFDIPLSEIALGKSLLFMKLSAWEKFERLAFLDDRELAELAHSFLLVRHEKAANIITHVWRKYRAWRHLDYFRNAIVRTIIPVMVQSRTLETVVFGLKLRLQSWAIRHLFGHAQDCIERERAWMRNQRSLDRRKHSDEEAIEDEAARCSEEKAREQRWQEKRDLELQQEMDDLARLDSLWQENAMIEEEQTYLELEAVRRRSRRDILESGPLQPLPTDFSPAFRSFGRSPTEPNGLARPFGLDRREDQVDPVRGSLFNRYSEQTDIMRFDGAGVDTDDIMRDIGEHIRPSNDTNCSHCSELDDQLEDLSHQLKCSITKEEALLLENQKLRHEVTQLNVLLEQAHQKSHETEVAMLKEIKRLSTRLSQAPSERLSVSRRSQSIPVFSEATEDVDQRDSTVFGETPIEDRSLRKSNPRKSLDNVPPYSRNSSSKLILRRQSDETDGSSVMRSLPQRQSSETFTNDWRDEQQDASHWRCSLLADVVSMEKNSKNPNAYTNYNPRASTSSVFVSPLMTGFRSSAFNHRSSVVNTSALPTLIEDNENPDDDVAAFLLSASRGFADEEVRSAAGASFSRCPPFTPLQSPSDPQETLIRTERGRVMMSPASHRTPTQASSRQGRLMSSSMREPGQSTVTARPASKGAMISTPTVLLSSKHRARTGGGDNSKPAWR